VIGKNAAGALAVKTSLFLVAAMLSAQAGRAQNSEANWDTTRPGIKEFQVPFASLKAEATFKIGDDADWLQITDDAVWVASSKPASVHRIDPKTNHEVAVVPMPGDPCAGLAFGFGSLWVPLCGKPASMARVDTRTNQISAILPLGPAGDEGGIAASGDSVWIVTDDAGTLARIDPANNKVRQTISIAPGSYNPCFGEGMVWITGKTSNLLTAVDAATGDVVATIPVGPKPRFLTASPGSIWTLNQGDGTVSRVDTRSKRVAATIQVGIPGAGGDIAWGANSIWTSVFGVPLTAIDQTTNKLIRQWVGAGGDALRFGHNSIWITDYKRGTLSRIAYSETQKSKTSP
jgi:virginiamycin B lyase